MSWCWLVGRSVSVCHIPKKVKEVTLKHLFFFLGHVLFYLKQTHGSVTSCPFRKLSQTNQSTDWSNRKNTDQPTDSVGHREVTLPIRICVNRRSATGHWRFPSCVQQLGFPLSNNFLLLQTVNLVLSPVNFFYKCWSSKFALLQMIFSSIIFHWVD